MKIAKSANILAIETATSACSVALCFEGQCFELNEIGKNVHSQVLLEMVQNVLDSANLTVADLSAIAVSQGPGSFTGLRIGIGVAQGLAYGVACPMIGVSTLDVLANQAQANGHVIAAIDARMGEVYWGDYAKDELGLKRLGPPSVTSPEQVIPSDNVSYQLLGNAWSEYIGLFDKTLMSHSVVDQEQLYPSAGSLLELAQNSYTNNKLISAIDFKPDYIRNQVAKKPLKSVP